MAERTAEADRDGAKVVIHDVPLLFENGLEGLYSDVVLVYAPERVQIKRLVEGRGISEDRARAIIAAQLPIDEKRGRAQRVIDNSGSREVTRAQVKRVWDELAPAR